MAAEGGRPDTDLGEPLPPEDPPGTPAPGGPDAGEAPIDRPTCAAGPIGTAEVDVVPPPEPDGPPPSAAPPALHPRAPARRLFEEGHGFGFFQAVRLLQRMAPGRALVGRSGPPQAEAVRFRARISLGFPPSAIHELHRPTTDLPVPVMVQAFMGLTGPSGVLPHHYTELLYRIERDVRTPEKHALRDWLDLFNHRLVSLFYRAWEKYRFYIRFERGDFDGDETDPFLQALFSLIGLGTPSMRRRLTVVPRPEADQDLASTGPVLARVDDLVLLHYGGLLGHRPRCAVALEAMIQDYFRVATRIDQFRGQWLKLEPAIRTRLGGERGNNEVGVSAVAGHRVWDRQSKFRVRIGPLTYARFVEFLPDRTPVRERKTFFLLAHLVRLYADPGLDFEVQLVLRAEEVPACRLNGDGSPGPRLGWNTWLLTRPPGADAEDVVIDGAVALACDPK